MSDHTNFYMLVTSLPHMPRTFEIDRVPITRRRLQQRLTMLGEKDAAVVDQVQRFLLWDRQHAERTDDEVRLEYDRLMNETRNQLVRHIIAYRMDVRTITSALRRRRLGMAPPTGVGQWVAHIRTHWNHPEFRLAREHPWISVVSDHLAARNALRAERQLLRATWNQWTSLADEYHFSFESVLLYLARWEIVDRWTRLNERLGRTRFESLLKETLRDHVPLEK